MTFPSFVGDQLGLRSDQVDRWCQGAIVDVGSGPCWVADSVHGSFVALVAFLPLGRSEGAGYLAFRAPVPVEGFARPSDVVD
eukprot:10150108-Heterocapsa_arctica.AAC.1